MERTIQGVDVYSKATPCVSYMHVCMSPCMYVYMYVSVLIPAPIVAVGSSIHEGSQLLDQLGA